tara:strand:- start:418 stop:663 length:246 start_codon:yes stop_codon:yes gene_type:complete
MADDAKKDEDFGKKCAHSGATLKKSKRYYRNGQYFVNKAAFKAKLEKDLAAAKQAEAEKAEAAKAEAEAAAEPAAEPEAKE